MLNFGKCSVCLCSIILNSGIPVLARCSTFLMLDASLILTLLLGITSNQNVSAYEAIQSMYKAKDLMYFKTSQQVLNSYKAELDNIKPRLKTIFEDEILTNRVYSVKVGFSLKS